MRGWTNCLSLIFFISPSTSTYPLPLCSKPYEHLFGNWVYDTNAGKSFLCCSWDEPKTHNPAECYREGPHSSIVYNPDPMNLTFLSPGSTFHPTFTGGHGCTCDRRDGFWTVHEREKWVWRPDKCSLPHWNATFFCELLHDRKVGLFGDSLMGQSFAVLSSMIQSGGGKCSNQIHKHPTDTFIDLKLHEGGHLHGRGGNLTSELMSTFDIIIFGTGAHHHSMASFKTSIAHISNEILLTQRNTTANTNTNTNTNINNNAKNKKGKRPPLFIYRSNIPGHMKRDATKPWFINSKKNPAETILSVYIANQKSMNDKYNYLDFSKYDTHAMSILSSLNVTLLDMSPLYLRPDGHSDALHFCLPGPLDLFSILLLQKLLLEEKQVLS